MHFHRAYCAVGWGGDPEMGFLTTDCSFILATSLLFWDSPLFGAPTGNLPNIIYLSTLYTRSGNFF